jgi:hypothetical protein
MKRGRLNDGLPLESHVVGSWRLGGSPTGVSSYRDLGKVGTAGRLRYDLTSLSHSAVAVFVFLSTATGAGFITADGHRLLPNGGDH